MKHQQVSVDYWAMGKAMVTYGALTVLVWIMLRLFNTALALPHRLRAQQTHIENTLKDLQKRYPDLNITEEDLNNAEKELEEFVKEEERADKEKSSPENDAIEAGTSSGNREEAKNNSDSVPSVSQESKKSI